LLKKCANPECLRPFHYLRDGRLVVVRHDAEGHGSHPQEFFWLCADCAPRYEVTHLSGGRLALHRIAPQGPPARAAEGPPLFA
jgi:hypothetical protein